MDALGIARFAAQKRPAATDMPEPVIDELRQMVRLRETAVEHLGDRSRQLHHALDLTFPEFTRYVRGLDTKLATRILSRYPTAVALQRASVRKLAALCFDGRRRIGLALARALIRPRSL